MDWPLLYGNKYTTAGIVTASSDGTTVTSGVANTKGSWVTLDASIPSGVTRFWLLSHTNTGTRNLIDIGVGAGPNSIIVSNLYAAKRTDISGWLYEIPCALPPGEALQVRFQAQSATATATFSVIYEIGGQTAVAPLGDSDTFGAEIADTSGITIDPGGTAHTKGSYVTIESATNSLIKSILLCFGGSSEMSIPPNRYVARWLFDIAIGGVSSEKVIIPNLGVSVNGTGDCLNRDIYGPFNIVIPANTRLSARCQSSETVSPDRLLDLVIIGFR